MNTKHLARSQVLHDQFARKLQPRHPDAAQLLQQKTVAAEDARSKRLLETDANCHLRRGAQESMPVHHVLLSRPDLYWDNVPRYLGRKRDLARILVGAIFGHKDAPA